MDDDQTRDAPPATRATVHGLPGQLPIDRLDRLDRLDYGDAEQLAEMTRASEPPEEPLILVDEPVQHPPYDRARQRRNRRPLPT
ncbi:hypothetical protein [Micromonospora andamanensis]|uniref:hypothetical protein n=1 Tax=Micromonospora andamanensis TaxID=1287068 RepID=UPI00363826DD